MWPASSPPPTRTVTSGRRSSARACRKAYGCGDHDQALLDGLTILARLVHHPNLTTSLYIHVNNAAIRSIQRELGACDEPLARIGFDDGIRASAVVDLADQGLIVLTVDFGLAIHAGGKSLSMVPHLSPYYTEFGRTMPIPMRGGGGNDGAQGDYEFVLMACVERARRR